MPYTIQTEDGIRISDIPDDIPPDSPVLKQRVKAIRDEIKAADINDDIGVFEAAAIGAGRGMMTVARGLGLADDEDESTKRAYTGLQDKFPISTTVGEIAGESAPFLLPGAGAGAALASRGAGLAARTAAAAGIGATEGAILARGSGADESTQKISAGVGGLAAGALELVMPSLGRLGRKIIRRATGRGPVGELFDATGAPTAELKSALDKLDITENELVDYAQDQLSKKAVDADQAARKAFLEKQGLSPTTAQITRDAGDFQLQQEAAKTSGVVREALENQEAILTSRFNNQVAGTGGNPFTPDSPVSTVITRKAEVLDKKIGALYKEAEKRGNRAKNISFKRLTQAIKDKAPSDTKAGGNIRALAGKMKEMGILDGQMRPIGRVDVLASEDLRQFANSLYDPSNPFGNMILRELKDSLDDDVFAAAGKDVFREARKAKADFEKGLARAKVSKFDARKQNIVQSIIENANTVNPEQFADKVVFSKGWRASDLRQMKRYLLDGTGEAGEQAFNDLRADVLEKIKERSFIGPQDANGMQALSADALKRTIKSIGPDKLKILFKPQELKFLRDIQTVATLRTPVRGTATGRGPSAQAIGRIEERLKKAPMLGSLIDFIDVDIDGKAVLKAKPKAIQPPAVDTPLALSQLGVSPVLGALNINEEEE